MESSNIEISLKMLKLWCDKNLDEYEKYVHPEFYMDPDELFISDIWDRDFILSTNKEKSMEYHKWTLSWQTYTLVKHNLVSSGDVVVGFIQFMFELHDYYHPELQRQLHQYGPVPYNMAIYNRFKDGLLVTACLIQDAHVFHRAIGLTTTNPDDELRKYLKTVEELRLI